MHKVYKFYRLFDTFGGMCSNKQNQFPTFLETKIRVGVAGGGGGGVGEMGGGGGANKN